jgi:predicted adenine nucleotide alpha hydrolase (AANH) superfamily ATPase
LKLIVDPYDHEKWLDAVRGLEDEPECGKRCRKCFEFNLKRTKMAAKNMGFATTLTVSPRKSSKVLFDVGFQWENFEAIDFKKKNGYLLGTRFAAEQQYYRQSYCGCEFSRCKADK